MRTTTTAIVLVAALATTARAQDSAEIKKAEDAVATARAALDAWAKTLPEDEEIRLKATDAAKALEPPAEPRRITIAMAEGRLELATRQLEAIRVAILEHASPRTETALGGDTETIDARALSEVAPDFPRPFVGFPVSMLDGWQPPAGMSGAVLTFATGNTWCDELGVDADKIMDLLGTALPRARVEISAGTLTIKGSAADRASARALVALLERRLAPVHLAVDVRAYAMKRATWFALDRGELVLDAEGEQRLARAEATGAARLVGRQTVATIDGQLSGLDLGATRTLLMPTDTSAVSSISPVRYRTGLSVEIRTHLSHDRSSVLVTSGVRLADPKKSGRGKVADVEVALPELSMVSARSATRIPLGRTGVVGGTFASEKDGADEPAACLVFVTPRIASIAARDQAVSQAPAVALPPTIEPLLKTIDAAIALARGHVRFEVFDVRDILGGHSDYPGPWLGPLGVHASSDSIEEEPGSEIDPEKLEQAVREDASAWGEWASYDLHRGSLLVRQSRDFLGHLAPFLEGLRKRTDRRVACEITVVRIDPALESELLEKSRATDPAAKDDGAVPGQIGPEGLALLEKTIAATPGRARVLGGGIVTAFDDQRVHVAQFRDRVHVAALHVGREQPGLGALRTGFVLDLRVRGEQDLARVSGRFSWAVEERGDVVEARNATVEGPAAQVSLEPFDGIVGKGSALFLTRRSAGEDTVLAAVIRPRLLDR